MRGWKTPTLLLIGCLGLVLAFQNCADDLGAQKKIASSAKANLVVSDQAILEGASADMVIERDGPLSIEFEFAWSIEGSSTSDFEEVSGVGEFVAYRTDVGIPLTTIDNNVQDGMRTYRVVIDPIDTNILPSSFIITVVDDESVQ